MYKIHPKTLFIGQIIQYLPSCQSTNDEASVLVAQQSPTEGLIVVTDNQTAGRGQRGNLWKAQAGQNLTFSLVLKPSFLNASEQFWLNMAISIGICDALQPLLDPFTANHDLRIKWPNDIYRGKQKLGGILIENTLQGYGIAWSVVGIGLNINQTELAYSTATSLQQQAPLPNGYDLPGLLSRLCETIEQRYLQLRSGHRDALKSAYLHLLFWYREEHWFVADDQRFRGLITGIDDVGRLLIATETGVRRFAFKEVAFFID